MNNEDKILEILDRLQKGQIELKRDVAEIKQDISELRQGQAEIKQDISDIKYDLREALTDIGSVEDRITRHEKELHSIGIKG